MKKDAGCMLVVSHYKDKDGHVVLNINNKRVFLHRYVYIQNHGEIEENQVVRHKCDNPHCVNVEHLEIGTHKDNVKDRTDRDRSAKGTSNGRSKLTEDNVRFIRNSTDMKISELAKMFNVDSKAIRNVLSYKTWKHVN